MMRPGVPTTTWAPCSRLSRCGRIGVPPHRASTLMLASKRARRRISCVTWSAGEALHKGKASMLGAASGAVAGLVAVTPAAGFVGPMGSIVIGAVAGFACIWGVGGLKRMLKADDAFDVFGVHGLGGIIGAILTGVFAAQSLGGTGGASPDTFAMGAQVWIQVKSVLFTIVWSGVVSFIAYKVVDLLVGLRVSEEQEREGLDISSHGETAYNR